MGHRLFVQELADGRVGVTLQRAGQAFAEPAGEPVAFASPLDEKACEDLRWYLEDYLLAPYAVYEEHGQQIQARLKSWGEALFGAVLGPGTLGHTAYIQAQEGGEPPELTVTSTTPGFLGLPWELLRDPQRATPLALDLTAFDRTLSSQVQATDQRQSGKELRVLMVIARPAGLQDVGYQMIARPLLQRLEAVSGTVQLDVLRPPTLEAFKAKLAKAQDEGRPYQIVHFDGHGTFGAAPPTGGSSPHVHEAGTTQGSVLFERETGGEHRVSAAEFSLIVNRAHVPLVVLNACRSGTLGQAAVEAAVATRLLMDGATSVVAMAYSVYAVAAAEFMAAFYEALFASKTVSEAVAAGRQWLFNRNKRPSPKGPLLLEDWIVPVHYTRRPLSFPGLQKKDPPPEGVPAESSLESVGRFIGRDAAFYELELALRLQRVVIVHGPGGTGKTELAKAFGRWWQQSGGLGNPDWVLFHFFEPGSALFGLDGVITAIGLKLFGFDFSKTTGPALRQARVLKELREHRMLLIWDNFESVFSMPDPTGATPPLDEGQRAAVREFVAKLACDGHSGLILTSRSPEDWLEPEHHRLELGGLTSLEAAELAEDVLAPYPRAQQRRQERAYAELLEWLGGHPLSLRLVLPQLEQLVPAALLAALRGEAQALPPGFAGGGGRLTSLGASVKYSFDHIRPALQERLPALALFEGVVDEEVLGLFSAAEGVPARFAGVSKADWAETLSDLAGLGLLSPMDGDMYALHPALPSYVMAEWHRLAGTDFATEQQDAQRALLAAYAVFGDWLYQKIERGSATIALALIERQRRTLGRLAGLAVAQGLYDEAKRLLLPLNEFWNTQGLVQEARGWVERVRAALEGADGTPPEADSAAGALWLSMLSSEADRSILAGDLAGAEAWYRKALEIVEALDYRPGAKICHHLGIVAQEQGDLDGAEVWYRKALEIDEELNDSLGQAMSSGQLGRVAMERRDMIGAEAWYRKALGILEGLGNQPHLATTYHQLGMEARERGDLADTEAWAHRELKIREALRDRPGLIGTYHQLGRLAQEREDLDEAEAWYRKALEIVETLNNQPHLAGTYHQLGIVAQGRGDMVGAEAWYRKALGIREALDDRPGMAHAYHQLGRLAQLRGDLDEAEAWSRKALGILEPLGNQPDLARSYFLCGRLAQLRGDLDEAEVWYRKASKIAEVVGDQQGMAHAYHQLGRLAVLLRGDLDEAEVWYRKASRSGYR